ncbi:guanine deaminase [Seohaeicola zhoushanensis]|uniref:Guanine deaminase n=1 Tax=Seohaeicola zhoushanensis TaxID=1569283 RepID=A0A8J3M3X9_9RHOB|nr:guanine deaminase [Seohaeicola zhoushanensis]GHF32690.1 guanine deaminase [Seohaeicola zhoushanensis]
MGDMVILAGRVLCYERSPFLGEPEKAARVDEAVALSDGRILVSGTLSDLRAAHPEAQVVNHGDKVILPGFVDAHAHYPQTAIIASWGKRLIDWLNTYTFPEEVRFADPAYAAEIAARYLDLVTANGTTTVCSYCTIHPGSAEALFAEAQKRDMRLAAGKTCMDRDTAPEGLRDTAQSAYDDSRALIGRWHGAGRLTYAITPRFSPTSTQEQLEALGALWAEHPDCLMQTHLSEQTDEIEWVLGLYPEARDYLDTYERHGLLGERGLYGHAIHLEPREKDRLREVGAGLVHCPTSNTFIGSGLFDMDGLMAAGHRVALATDTGGGSSFSMLRTMAAAYEVGQLRGRALHAAELLWLATAGSAQALHMGHAIGTIAPGMEADLVVLDLAATPALAQRTARARDIWEALFATIMLGDDRCIAEVRINGRLAG